MNFQFICRVLAWGCLLMPLVACSQEDRLPPIATAQISPYNHTPDYIDHISIDRQGGGNSFAFGGGGSFVCFAERQSPFDYHQPDGRYARVPRS